MANVLLVAYLLIVLALIVVILLQRSEGGALGIGGGGGGLMTARGSANLLTRTTAILATLFFLSAIGLTILNELDRGTSGILENAVTTPDGEQPSTVLDALNALQGEDSSDLPLPAEAQTPATATDTDLPVPAAPQTETTAPATDTAPAAAPATEASDLPVPAAPAEQTPAAPPAN